ncbi:hypothetical protein [Jatrophihabitans sp.]|uniref:hypothetical protein n=1 Tax=Jatrophihabitans sp. TaxID=1932789 RepID=UPI002B84E883|nr:hypothetical protein [Jatrophihabitans sp.]
MSTKAAQRAERARTIGRRVMSPAELTLLGVSRSQLAANLAANRWQRCGRAVVLHSGQLTQHERWHAALINCGPRSVLTAFTAAELAGLRGWERPVIHVLGPQGAVLARGHNLPVRLHRTRFWPVERHRRFRCQGLPGALVVAAGTMSSERPAAGILAAAVQQRLVTPAQLLTALQHARRIRHRVALCQAVHDIAGGAQALSEIDFVRLCRRAGLPMPERQKVRRDSSGRRRYLDAAWRRGDGRLVVVEVDGALHLSPQRWWDDQARQNELSLADALVLRFPSAMIRAEEKLVVAQLRRALQLS